MQSPRLVKKLKENKMADQPPRRPTPSRAQPVRPQREPLTARSAQAENPEALGAREALRQSAARRQFDEANRLIGATPAPSTSEVPLGPETAPSQVKPRIIGSRISPEKAEGGSDPNKGKDPPFQEEIPVLEMPNPQLDTVFEDRRRPTMPFYEAIMRRRQEQE